MAVKCKLVEKACRKAGWEIVSGGSLRAWEEQGVIEGIGLAVLLSQVRRLNADPEAERVVRDWVARLPTGRDGCVMAWWGLVEGVGGYRLVDWERIWANRFQVGIRVPVYWRPGSPEERARELVWVPGILWVNGLPVAVISVRQDQRERGINRMWRWMDRCEQRSARLMTIAQAVVMVHRDRVWVEAPWWRSRRSPGRRALWVSDGQEWLTRLCAPGRVMAWLERGIRYASVIETRWPIKILARPESDGTLPRWVAVPGGASGERRRGRRWTEDERARREAKLGRLMEAWMLKKPRMTPTEAASCARYYLKLDQSLFRWTMALAVRVKKRLLMRRARSLSKRSVVGEPMKEVGEAERGN